MPEMPKPETPRQRRWDPVVKLTHWAVALAVLANAVITEEGSAAHVWVGYALVAILALRLLWGLIGPAEARFSAFAPSPRKALAHLGDIAAKRHTVHRSHNPLGALMVYAIWGTLLVIIGTGVAMAGLPFTPGTERRVEQSVSLAATAGSVNEAAEEGEDDASEDGKADEEGGEGPLGEVHEAAVNLLYGLILLHIGGVLFESRRQKRNLALAMLPGGG
ncbi:cytochrome b/b6 domain-containing protein [Novosphingobium sp.]|uniref:cytochrome b/b6 domain-containing protein n=1 Tax=Novosphingobium sp. TaxID=1874826 RepID=UPI00262CB979|nr:cytochrome b/b6 domain-containing protein [Novosphingobium sp.]